jgi:hypothetical protein
MRSSAEVLDFIDRYLSNACARPEGYASSPEQLEDTICLLQMVRGVILERNFEHSDYFLFLAEFGYGSGGAAYDAKHHRRDISDEDLIKRIAELLAEFLKREGRFHPPSMLFDSTFDPESLDADE